jgi:hypothetical protein
MVRVTEGDPVNLAEREGVSVVLREKVMDALLEKDAEELSVATGRESKEEKSSATVKSCRSHISEGMTVSGR